MPEERAHLKEMMFFSFDPSIRLLIFSQNLLAKCVGRKMGFLSCHFLHHGVSFSIGQLFILLLLRQKNQTF
jgi:hypothetical protein